MSYLAIARKWRPQRFDEIVGQAHVTRTLQNAIRLDRVHHAFLFTGARGVGKTTAARILAKALNCEHGPAPEPCNACPSCQEITSGISSDVQEIDAASNTGVDNIRDLRERLRYLPSSGRYRIYIIDEIHMLSTQAFNALLKTLEEPPPHVLFIFATTDPQKLPDTILSRCQRFDFKRIPVKLLTEKLREIAGKDGVEITESALLMIAREAEGSMRDAESLLDQVMSAAVDRVDEHLVAEVLGLFDRRFLFDCVEGLLSGDADKSIQIVDQVHTFGFDLKPFTRDLLEVVRHLNVIKVAGNPERLMDVSAEEFDRLKQLAKQTPQDVLSRQFSLLLQGYDEVSRSELPRLALEMTLLRMARVRPVQPLDDLLARLNTFERALRRAGLAAAKRVSGSPGEAGGDPGGGRRPDGASVSRDVAKAAGGAGASPAPPVSTAGEPAGGEAGVQSPPRGNSAPPLVQSREDVAPRPVSAPAPAPPVARDRSPVPIAEQPVSDTRAEEGEDEGARASSGGDIKTWYGFMTYWERSSGLRPVHLQRARIATETPDRITLAVEGRLALSRTMEELRKPRTQERLQRYFGRKVVVTCQALDEAGKVAPSYQEMMANQAKAHKQALLDKIRADDTIRAAARIFDVQVGAIDVETGAP